MIVLQAWCSGRAQILKHPRLDAGSRLPSCGRKSAWLSGPRQVCPRTSVCQSLPMDVRIRQDLAKSTDLGILATRQCMKRRISILQGPLAFLRARPARLGQVQARKPRLLDRSSAPTLRGLRRALRPCILQTILRVQGW